MNNKYLQGSFTAEIAMIMGVVLFVIFSVLIGGRMIYNRAKIVSYQYEYAITQREKELIGLWGESRERIGTIELEELEPVKHIRNVQYLREM